MRNLGLAALAALSLAGCASATRGWSENITVSTTPSEATATFNITGEAPKTCVTPCVMQVKRQDEITIDIVKDGYQPEVVALTKEITSTGAAGFAGNLLLGGVVGGVVDAASGAALDHKPNPVILTLKPIAPPPPPPRGTKRSRPVS
jgi:hypothetical protein